MASEPLPNVSFGRASDEPYPWRDEEPDDSDLLDNDEDEEPSPTLIEMLGFDPREIEKL